MLPEELSAFLKQSPEWSVEAGELVRTFPCADFAAAIRFVQRVAELAEAAQHHPDMDIRFDRVKLRLRTHDTGCIGVKDLALARAVQDDFRT